MPDPIDAVLLIAFGGPEGPDDVFPFLQHVTAGRGVPPERLRDVAGHYAHFGGKSPINEQMRAAADALAAGLAASPQLNALPVYLGNRHWHPFLAESLRRMAADGIGHALGLIMVGFQCDSSWQQYQEAVTAARDEIGPGAPAIVYGPPFCTQPLFLDATVARVRDALAEIPPARRASAALAFTAHSIPATMAADAPYEAQLRAIAQRTAERLGHERWSLVYQSRSGRSQDPWLEPDICDHLGALHAGGVRDVVVAPIGFLSDHVEVLYDLDTEAGQRAVQLGLNMTRARTVGGHPLFHEMLLEVVRAEVAKAVRV